MARSHGSRRRAGTKAEGQEPKRRVRSSTSDLKQSKLKVGQGSEPGDFLQQGHTPEVSITSPNSTKAKRLHSLGTRVQIPEAFRDVYHSNHHKYVNSNRSQASEWCWSGPKCPVLPRRTEVLLKISVSFPGAIQ